MATAAGAAGSREMTVGGVVSRAFAAVGAAPLTFFGTGFVLSALPAALLGMVMRTAVMTPLAARTAPATVAWPLIGAAVLVW